MKYSLRSLLIVAIVAPALLAGGYISSRAQLKTLQDETIQWKIDAVVYRELFQNPLVPDPQPPAP